MYCVILPPFSVSDELTHFLNGYHIANIIQGKKDIKTDKVQGEFDVIILQYRDVDEQMFIDGDTFIYDFSYDSVKYIDLFDKPLLQRETVYKTKECIITRYFPFPEYVIMGISIAIGRLIGLSTYYLVCFTRIINMIVYALLGSLAIRILPYAKNMFYVIMLLPVGIYNVCGISYHAVLYAETFLLFSYILYLKHKQSKVSLLECLAVFAFMSIIAPAKGVFLFYFVYCLILPSNRFSSKTIYHVYIIGIIATSLTFWLGYNLLFYDVKSAINNTANYNIISGEVPKTGLYSFVTVIITFLRNIIKTIFVRGFYIDRSLYQIKFDTGSLSFCLSIYALIISVFYDYECKYALTGKCKLLIALTYLLSYGLMSFVGYIAMKSTKVTDLIELKSIYCYQFLPLIGFLIRPKNAIAVEQKRLHAGVISMVALIHTSVFFTIIFNAMIL